MSTFRLNSDDELNVQPLKWASSSTFNALCGMLHLGSGAFILIEDRLASFIDISSAVKVNRVALDVRSDALPWSLVLKDAGEIRVFLLIASFLLITGCVHFFYAWRQLKYGDTPGFWFRYIEYSVTAPIMIVIIAILLGIREVYLLVLMALLTSITMIYGSIQDRLAKPIEEWAVNPAVFILYPFFSFLIVFLMFFFSAFMEIWDNNLVDHFLKLHLRAPLVYARVVVEGEDDSPMVWYMQLKQWTASADMIYPLIAAVLITVLFRVYNFRTGDYGFWLSETIIVLSLWSLIVLFLAGISEVYFLTLMISLVPTTGTFYYIYRKLRNEGSSADWPISPHAMGYIPYGAVWAVILSYYAISVRDNDGPPPWYVNAIVFGELLLFTCFAFVQYYYVVWPQWRSGSNQYETIDEDNQTRMDGAYNILSLGSKLLLCWLCFGGIAGQQAGTSDITIAPTSLPTGGVPSG